MPPRALEVLYGLNIIRLLYVSVHIKKLFFVLSNAMYSNFMI